MAVAPIAPDEADATIAALKPPKRERPLIAIIGINDATEATDYLMPFGVLRRADVADVLALATKPGPVTLYPAPAGRAPGDGGGVRCAASGRRRLCDRPRHEPRRRPGGTGMGEEPGVQGSDRHRRLCGSKGGRRSRAARWQAGDDALVLHQGAAQGASRGPLCRGPALRGRPGRCDDDRDHRVHAVAHL